MISFRTQLNIAQFIQAVSEGERKLEVSRQVLAEKRSFEPYTAFKRLDRFRKGYLDQTDIEKFLLDNDVFMTTKEMRFIFNFLDCNEDGRVTYSEFMKMILPQEDMALREISSSRKPYMVNRNEGLPYDSEWALIRCFQQIAKNGKNCEDNQDILSANYDFSPKQSFLFIDDLERGFLNAKCLDKFLKKFDIFLSEDELDAFFRVVDKDLDGVVSFEEWSQFVSPKPSYGKSLSRIKSTEFTSKKVNQPLYSRSTYATPAKSTFKRRKSEELNEDYAAYSTIKKEKSKFSETQSKYYTPQSSKYRSEKPEKQEKRENLWKSKKNWGSPMKGNEESQLVRALKEQIQIDKEIESAKKSLALRPDFSLLDGFRLFDKKGKGRVTKSELSYALSDLGVYASPVELSLLFKHFDPELNGFLRMVSPQVSKEYANILKEREPSYNENDEELFSFETRRNLRDLINLVINGEVQAEALRQKLLDRPLFSVTEAFEALDKNENGYVTLDEFRSIFEEYGIFATQTELKGLLKRYDKNQDGKVSYYEFVEEMRPKSPSKIKKY